MRARAPRRRVSQADVARAAGVSPALVSVVVNNRVDGPIRISEATRSRVRQTIEELGYVPDPAARRMVGAASNVLGVFTYESVFPLGGENFYREFLVGVEDAAEEVGRDLLLVTSSRRVERRSLYANGVNGLRLADGGLLIGSDADSDEMRRLIDEGYPFVFIGERHIDGCELSFAAADYIGGTRAAIGRLHDLGHRRIALLASHHDPVPGRREGYRQGCRGWGLELREVEHTLRGVASEDRAADIRRILDDLLAAGVTAVLTQSSHHARLVRTEARTRGLVLGRDLSLVDLGGDVHAAGPGELTALDLPRREMGREAVRLLLALIDEPDGAPYRVWLDCPLVDGGTVGPPPA